MLAVYVSGHGFGHSTRTAEVLRLLRARAPELPIVVSTSAPASLFESVVAPPLELRWLQADVGLVQRDALRIDLSASARAWREFASDWDDRVAGEARWLERSGARLVLADIPPLAFAAASAAGLRAVGLGNFSWDWIYSGLAAQERGLASASTQARTAYASASLMLRLPFAGDLSAFPRVEDVPLVARRPRLEKGETRRRLGLDDAPLALLSFGGIGAGRLEWSGFGALEPWRLLVTGLASGALTLPENVRALAAGALEASAVEYPDLVGAADVVVTKPGYGIVSDCIGAHTPLVYTERGDFPEYPIMVEEMRGYLPAVHVRNQRLRRGRLGAELAAVLELPWPAPPRLDGAEVAAGKILGLL